MSTKDEVILDADYRAPKILVHSRETPNYVARLAEDFVNKWGMVAATTDGEDSSGRSKLRQLTPAELVERACDTSALLVEEMRKRGWMIELPSLVEAIAAKKAEDDAKEEARRAARAS